MKTGRLRLFSIIVGVSWIVFLWLLYAKYNVDEWRATARSELSTLKTRVALSNPFSATFTVYHNGSHAVGIEFDDRRLADSLDHYIGYYHVPDFHFAIHWVLFKDGELVHQDTVFKSFGSRGHAQIFGQFEASTSSEYSLSLNCLTLPNDLESDSATLHIEVNRAAVSVGNELTYDLIKRGSYFFIVPSAILSTLLTLVLGFFLIRNKLQHANGV